MIYDLATLRFDNPNNAAISLQVVAELVRRGDLVVTASSAQGKESETGQMLSVEIVEPKKTERRRTPR